MLKIPLWKKVLFGLGLGVLLGLLLRDDAIYLKPFGEVFIRLIRMIIVPMIFCSIVNGMISIQDSSTLGRLGGKAVVAYICTTISAVFIGLLVGNILRPGEGLHLGLQSEQLVVAKNNPNFLSLTDKLLTTLIPDNAIASMAQGYILQVVFFALFTGITINTLDRRSIGQLRSAFKVLAAMVFKMVYLITKLSPLAACALTAWVVGTQGTALLKNLFKLIYSAYIAFAVQYLVFGLIIKLWTKLSPVNFFKKSLPYQLIAFSTTSTKAALPVAIKACRENLGVSNTSATFILPLGTAINMDGIAIYSSLCAVFFAQAIGKVLLPSDYALIVLTSTLGAIGGAGIPSGTIFILPMIFSALGLPMEGIALIVGIDRIIDMMRTVISITGDVCVALCVDHSENLLDRNKYCA